MQRRSRAYLLAVCDRTSSKQTQTLPDSVTTHTRGRACTRLQAMAAMHSIEELAARHAPAVNAILEEADGLTDRALQIQAIAGRVMAVLESEGLVSRERVAPQNVGVHSCNRNGAMVDPHHVHELLAMFVLKGFNPGECRQALAAQISPGDDGAKERAKNEQLTKRSYNLLAPCQGDRLKVLTVINSHTSAVLRAVQFSDEARIKVCPATQHLAGNDGVHLSRGRVLELCSSLRKPSDEGIEYIVIPHQLTALCPTLMSVLSEADNAKHSTYRRETALQTMMNLHKRIVQAVDDDEDIVDCICPTNPPSQQAS